MTSRIVGAIAGEEDFGPGGEAALLIVKLMDPLRFATVQNRIWSGR
jgi:hypothetical protein